MAVEEKLVAVDRSENGWIATVTLNKPETLNSLSKKMVGELAQAFRGLCGDPDLRAVILTGRGRSFSAGVDLTDPPHAVTQAEDVPASLDENPTYWMAQVPVPIIAAVNGHCITGGMELALACDVLVGSTLANFRDTHVKFGFAPCWGLSQRLPRLVGASRAALFSYTAAKLDAKTALEWGLLAKMVPPENLMAAVREIADEIAANDPGMVRKYKATLQRGFLLPLQDALKLERELAVKHYKEMDLTSGVSQWKAKL